jgi:L-alanine-DL-glutamate epimerase-like enolase superfamily enzyme
VLTIVTSQSTLKEPLRVEADGCVRLPSGPGLGVAIDESKLA